MRRRLLSRNELPRRADAPGHSILSLTEPDPERYPRRFKKVRSP